MPRHLPTFAPLPLREGEPAAQLRTSLTHIVANSPPDQKPTSAGRGLYSGPLSLSYLFLRLDATHGGLEPALHIKSRPLRHWSIAYLRQGLAAQEHYGTDATLARNGIGSSALAALALSASISGDEIAALSLCSYAETLTLAHHHQPSSSAAPEAMETPPVPAPDWLSGLAGYLYLLRLVRTSSVFTHDTRLQREIRNAEDETIEALLAPHPSQQQQEQKRPRWCVARTRAGGVKKKNLAGHVYLGAVHGIAGILTQIVLSCPSRAEDVRGDLEDLLTAQLEDGNWPSHTSFSFSHSSPPVSSPSHSSQAPEENEKSENEIKDLIPSPTPAPTQTENDSDPNPNPDTIAEENKGKDQDTDASPQMHFSNGTPGILSSLLSLRPHYHDLHAAIDAAVARGRARILEACHRDLLTKREGEGDPGLCHGITGISLALPRGEMESLLALMLLTTTEATTEMEGKTRLMQQNKDNMVVTSTATTTTTTSSNSNSDDDDNHNDHDNRVSLWHGEGGRAWAWAIASFAATTTTAAAAAEDADIEEEEEEADKIRVIGFNDI
ncbi:MAG: hypothetical protein M1819_002177 [Sarea resinae]|nr:MAG: hypothetical protein M1819_002177 [Sarea resinae]